MSGSDIRDILEIGKPTEAAGPRRLNKPVEKRPEGISRELYSLIGGAPSVNFATPTYKAKFNVKKKATPWILETFTNAARSDDLQLQHWVKSTEADNGEYPFVKYNKHIDVVQYTDEEYEKYLSDLDHHWSKEETDYLLHLCRIYGLRFPVIEDRYNFGSRERTLEDLKERYYSILGELTQRRRPPGSDSIPMQYVFDKVKEIERKEALKTLFTRTKEEMEEEEALLVQVKRIEQNEARLAREKEGVEQLLAEFDQSAANLASSQAGTSADSKKRKREELKNKKAKKPPVPPEEEPKEKLISGMYVRSHRLPDVKPHLQTKVAKVLDEVGVGSRPVIPTERVCQRFEHLQNSIVCMFELKKVVDKMEIEHRIKTRNGTMGTKRSANTASTSSGTRRRRP